MLYRKAKTAEYSTLIRSVSTTAKAALLSLFVSTGAQAATVTGSVTLAASFGFVFESGVGAGVDFVDFGSAAPSPAAFDTDLSPAQLTGVTGDFVTAGITAGSLVSIKDFRFDLVGVSNPIVIGSVFEFSITSVTPPTTFTGVGAGDFSGSGILHDTSGTYDDTLFDFTYNNVNDQIALITNTATGNPSPVPVPGAAWLFGSACIALFGRRRMA